MRIRGVEFRVYKNGGMTINKWRLHPGGVDFFLKPREVQALHALLKLHYGTDFTIEFGYGYASGYFDARAQNRWCRQNNYVVVITNTGFYCQLDPHEMRDFVEWLDRELGE